MTSTPSTARERHDVSLRSLVGFLLLTFGVAWGVLSLYILWPDPMSDAFGALSGSHPLFVLAVYAPAIAAFLIVARYGGTSGVKRYLSRLGLWRCPPAWYGFLLLGVPVVFVLGSALKGNLGQQPWPVSSVGGAVAILALRVILGPIEEFGWRGVALPLLQRRLAPIWAGSLLGLIWGIWHLPAFVLSGTPQSAWSFTPFLLGTVALSVTVTPLFNASRGSILLPAFFHFQVINPFWPDAEPYDSYLFIAVAIVVVWLNRETMLRKEGGVTEVVPRAGASPQSERTADQGKGSP